MNPGLKPPITAHIALPIVFLVFACSERPKPVAPSRAPALPVYTLRIVNIYPHDKTSFTQGLAFHEGSLYEGTGKYGASAVQKMELESGRVFEEIPLGRRYFGEGITLFRDRLIQLTWKSRKGFIYDTDPLKLAGEFQLRTEGWGITHDGKRLIISDGTHMLHLLDPMTFDYEGVIEVRERGKPVINLNELEFVKGEILANVLPSNRIARIDAKTGNVTAWIEAGNLLLPEELTGETDALNGIAHDPEGDRLFLTGKYWPKIFEVEVVRHE